MPIPSTLNVSDDRPPVIKSLGLSILLHSCLVLLFLQMSTEAISVPTGDKIRGNVEYVEFATTDVAVVQTTSKNESIEKEITLKIKRKPKLEKKAKRISPDSDRTSQRGSENADRAQGEMGSPNGIDVSARERYLYELTALLNERRVYPLSAKRLGESGRVVVKFMIRGDGAIENVEVAHPSSSSRLNRAAFHLAEGIKKFKPLPEELMRETNDRRLALEVPITYSIQ